MKGQMFSEVADNLISNIIPLEFYSPGKLHFLLLCSRILCDNFFSTIFVGDIPPV